MLLCAKEARHPLWLDVVLELCLPVVVSGICFLPDCFVINLHFPNAPGLLIKAGQHKEGHGLALFSSLLLLGGMAPRAVKTGKFMPAGLVASLGALSAVYQGKKVQEWW